MIEVSKVRELDLKEAIQKGRSSFLSAASGLVRAGSFLYVIADDEHHLAVFNEDGKAPGEVLRLFEGELPIEEKPRKKVKPDLEALTLLPADFQPPHGALLAIPSGSKPHRCTGALVPLDDRGAVGAGPALINLTHVYAALERRCGPLNIEGAAVFGPTLYLLNRGNKKHRNNTLIALELSAFLDSVTTGTTMDDSALLSTCPLDLGDLNGVPLTPTDATMLASGHLLFTAAAEGTDSSFEDGACHGSAVGIMDLSGKILFLENANTKRKLEGIDARVEGEHVNMLLVNDEDSHTQPSELQRAAILFSGRG